MTLLFFGGQVNFGCDCNRHLEFLRAGSLPFSVDDKDSRRCGYKEYTVIDATFEDGTVIEIDEEEIDCE